MTHSSIGVIYVRPPWRYSMREPMKPSVTGTTFDTQRTIDGGR